VSHSARSVGSTGRLTFRVIRGQEAASKHFSVSPGARRAAETYAVSEGERGFDLEPTNQARRDSGFDRSAYRTLKQKPPHSGIVADARLSKHHLDLRCGRERDSIGVVTVRGVGVGMDPVMLIATALAAGAALGLKDTASAAVKDAYGSLKALATRRLSGRRNGELVLARHEDAPQAWEGPLVAELTAAGAADDAGLVAAAQALMSLVDEIGSRAGKYAVQVQGSQGVQVGDHNTQHNVFGAPPGR
jgi:hypothetical protein